MFFKLTNAIGLVAFNFKKIDNFLYSLKMYLLL